MREFNKPFMYLKWNEVNPIILGKRFFVYMKGRFSFQKGHLHNPEGLVEVESPESEIALDFFNSY